ncbi:MAG: hypothetical protein V7L23_11300 [Nostoc sp.]
MGELILNFSSFATAVAHGGNPQDRAASFLRPLRFVLLTLKINGTDH